MTVNAGLSLRACRLRNAHTIHTNLGRLAGVRNASAALFVLAVRTDRNCNTSTIERAKASGTRTGRRALSIGAKSGAINAAIRRGGP